MDNGALNAHEAARIRNSQRLALVHTLRQIIELLERKIRTASSLGHDDTVFDIPNNILGFPCFEMPIVAQTLLTHLREKDFYCKQIGTRGLYISWKHPGPHPHPQKPKSKTPTPKPKQPKPMAQREIDTELLTMDGLDFNPSDRNCMFPRGKHPAARKRRTRGLL